MRSAINDRLEQVPIIGNQQSLPDGKRVRFWKEDKKELEIREIGNWEDGKMGRTRKIRKIRGFIHPSTFCLHPFFPHNP